MASEYSFDLLQIHHRPDLDMLVGRWSYQPEPTELPAAYTQLSRAALAYNSRRWLQDIRRRTLNDAETSRWLLAEYFPGLVRQLGGRLTVAYLTSPTLMHIILSSPSFQPPGAYTDQPFGVAFFTDEGEAMDWLRQP